jgi:glycosyltransferase involved in cell wall biosynthesis
VQLIVLGMHRSGTSAVTRLLNMAGAYFGPEGSATPANEENAKGFWERRDVRRLCDGLLHDSGFDWWRLGHFDVEAIPDKVRDEHFGTFRDALLGLDAHRPWVIKEPRLCLLFPLLRPVLEVPVCIHVTREPLEVAASVAARNGFPLPVCVALWEFYTLRSVQASVGLPRYHVRYEDLRADPVATLDRLLAWLETQDVHGLHRPSDQEITAFVDPALHRQQRDASGRHGLLNGQQAELATATDAGELFDPRWEHREPSDSAWATLRDYEERVDQIAKANDEAKAARDDAEARVRAAEQERTRVEAAARDDASAARDAARRRVGEIERIVDDGLREAEKQLQSIERSRAWRLAQRAMRLRQGLMPGVAREDRGRIERVVVPLSEVRRALESSARAAGHETSRDARSDDEKDRVERLRGGVSLRHAGAPHERTSPSRSKVAVIAWDVGHNPLGRAYCLAEILARRFDVEIWGAQFERYGDRIWAPLQKPDLPIHYFDGRSFPEHLDVMEAVAKRIDADAIWVSKPRFPSLGLGVLAKRLRNRPLVLDVDDHELSFFAVDEGLDLDDLRKLSGNDLELPFERAWTRACDPMIAHADARTVSNVALQERYGGVLVPHARDERRFDPELYDRDAVRARLGVGPSDRLLLFGGTPRIHKGLVEVLEALDRLGDPRYKLALFGTGELAKLRDRVPHLERWIVPLPYQPFSELPSIVGAADLSCVLQDPAHPVARYQMPAKVVDALAMGVPCLVTATPPLRPLVDAGVLNVHHAGESLPDRIAAIFEDPDDARDRARRGRKVFLEEYSCEAVCDRVAPLFEQLIANPPELAQALDELVTAPRRLLAPRASATDGGDERTSVPARTPGSRRWRAAPGEQYDLVVFWRQNDTSIYGRRQDMLLKYLQRSGRFAKIVHFDSPISPGSLARTYLASTGRADQRHLVVRQTMKRLLHLSDEEGVVHRTFLYGAKSGARTMLRTRSEYPDYVASVLAKHGVGKRLTVFWVYPINEYFPTVVDALLPDLVIADVVDDNRTWHRPSSHLYGQIERNYQDILSRSDVVLANCAPVAERMTEFAPEVHLVPNGCEAPDGSPPGARPAELRSLSGPVIGYVGNMSDRIDIDLLDDLARARPAWQFVYVGSAHLDQSILRLDRHANVHFVGVKPYEEAKRFIRHFDVALIPHLDNDMTRSMNPLKGFVYCAAGVPVVSTPIANMDELGDLITVAKGVDGFLGAIEDALATGRRAPDLEVLEPHTWERRVEQVLGLIDEAAGATEPR